MSYTNYHQRCFCSLRTLLNLSLSRAFHCSHLGQYLVILTLPMHKEKKKPFRYMNHALLLLADGV